MFRWLYVTMAIIYEYNYNILVNHIRSMKFIAGGFDFDLTYGPHSMIIIAQLIFKRYRIFAHSTSIFKFIAGGFLINMILITVIVHT